MIRKIQPIMNMKENKSLAKNLELHSLQWNKHLQKRVIIIQSFKIKAERWLLWKLKTIICFLFDKNQNHNGSEKIPPQYETVNPKSKIKNIQTEHKLHTFPSTYIHGHIPTRIAIHVHIYIHTWPQITHVHKNTRAWHKRERDRKRKRKCEREKLGGTIQYCNLKT